MSNVAIFARSIPSSSAEGEVEDLCEESRENNRHFSGIFFGGTLKANSLFEDIASMASSNLAVGAAEDASEDQRSTEEPPSNVDGSTSIQTMFTYTNLDESDRSESVEGLFSLDEDQPKVETGKLPKFRSSDFESDAEYEPDDFHTNSGTANPPTGALAYGTSLPVTIPAGRFWPPKEAVDSITDEGGLLSSGDESVEGRAKTVLPQRIHKDLYREIRAQARSVQAADDPERLFGERPQRRRYQTGETSAIPRAIPHHENAVVIVAASFAGRI